MGYIKQDGWYGVQATSLDVKKYITILLLTIFTRTSHKAYLQIIYLKELECSLEAKQDNLD